MAASREWASPVTFGTGTGAKARRIIDLIKEAEGRGKQKERFVVMTGHPIPRARRLAAAVMGTGIIFAVAPVVAGGSPPPASDSAARVPSGFAANSITWISPTVGWILGSARNGTKAKTDIVGTVDGGKTWRLVASIKAAIPQVGTGGSGVTELRFATAKVGYAFGPGLYRTMNGGTTFSAMPLPGGGKQVLALAANAKQVYMVVSPCTFASGICSHKPLGLWRRSLVSKGAWTHVPVSLPINDAADLSLHGTSVYVVDAQRNVTGKLDKLYASTDGVRFASRPVPCDRFPDIALLQAVATSRTGVDLLCDGNPGFGKAVKFAYRSSDTGKKYVSAGTMGDSWGIEAGMTVSPTGNMAVASWSIGSFMWINVGRKTAWSMVIGLGDGGRGWNDPTYVSAKVAWVVYSPVDLFNGLGKVYRTTNSGESWHPVTL